MTQTRTEHTAPFNAFQAFYPAPHVDDVVEERISLLAERRALAQD